MQYEDRITIATPEGIELDVTLAGLGSRTAAAVIDTLIKGAVSIALLFATGFADALFGSVFEDTSGAVGFAIVTVLLFLVWFGYDVLFETLASGRTPGKRAAGIRVVRMGGRPVGLIASTIRNLLRMVDGLPTMYGVGIVSILVTSNNQRVGDLAAGTLVVRERRVAPSLPTPAMSREVLDYVHNWDVSAVSAEEVATVRQFLDRRGAFTPQARYELALQLDHRLRPRVAGVADDLTPEQFLEFLSAAKAARG